MHFSSPSYVQSHVSKDMYWYQFCFAVAHFFQLTKHPTQNLLVVVKLSL